jgi:hypothetical protein
MVRTEVTKISLNCSFSVGTAAFSRVKIKEKLVTEIETCCEERVHPVDPNGIKLDQNVNEPGLKETFSPFSPHETKNIERFRSVIF